MIKTSSSNFFIFLPNYRLVKGSFRSIIVDVNNFKIAGIPNSLFDFIVTNNKKSVDIILGQSECVYNSEYLDFLVENNYAIIGSKYDSIIITDINDDFDLPYFVSNAIVDVNSTEILFQALNSLIEIEAQNIQIRVFSNKVNLNQVLNSLELLNTSNTKSLELVVPYFNDFQIFFKSCHKIERLSRLFVYNSPPQLEMNDIQYNFQFQTSPSESINEKSCGLITARSFYVSIPMFHESKHHNSCLNRKISIDSEGNIKNCPSMAESFGNIKDTTLAEAIEKPGFKKYWNINKDQIAVCKDCEFRYICTDCRAYVEEPEDASGPNGTNLSKPLKCGYNPYTGEWAEWSTNPLKQEAIDFYGMREILDKMNQEKAE